MRKRIGYATIPVAAVLALTACGGGAEPAAQEQDVTTTTEAPATSSTTSSSAVPEPSEALTEGIIVHQCEIGGSLTSSVTSYDPDLGEVNGSVTFEVADTTGNTQSNVSCSGSRTTHEDGQKFRSAFNEDFTKFFVEVKESATGTSVVGYYNLDGEFIQISKTGDEFTKTDDRSPAFHIASGKLFYWSYGADEDEPTLMSVVPDSAAAPQPEPELAKMAYYGHTTYTPLTEKPLIVDFEDDVAFNDAGTLVAGVGGDGIKISPAGDPANLANNVQAVPFDRELTLKFGQPPVTVGFADDDSVIFTDGQQIFRADVQGEQAVVTVLHANTNEDTTVSNITIRKNKGSVAFLATSGGETTLYVKQIDGAGEAVPVRTFGSAEVRILQFSD